MVEGYHRGNDIAQPAYNLAKSQKLCISREEGTGETHEENVSVPPDFADPSGMAEDFSR